MDPGVPRHGWGGGLPFLPPATPVTFLPLKLDCVTAWPVFRAQISMELVNLLSHHEMPAISQPGIPVLIQSPTSRLASKSVLGPGRSMSELLRSQTLGRKGAPSTVRWPCQALWPQSYCKVTSNPDPQSGDRNQSHHSND